MQLAIACRVVVTALAVACQALSLSTHKQVPIEQRERMTLDHRGRAAIYNENATASSSADLLQLSLLQLSLSADVLTRAPDSERDRFFTQPGFINNSRAQKMYGPMIAEKRPVESLWDGRLALRRASKWPRMLGPNGSGLSFAQEINTSLKFAVCITGQLARLEIPSKVKHVATPLSRKGHVDIFVVLETDSNMYVNNDSKAANSCDSKDTWMTPSQVEEKFGSFYKDGIFMQHATIKPNMKYWPERYGTDKPWIARDARLGSHINQWHHMAACAQLVRDAETESGASYDTILRLRDNSIAVGNAAPYDNTWPPTVLTKACSNWGGYNDKTMLAARKRMDCGFSSAAALARRVEAGEQDAINRVSHHVQNPEQFLRTALLEYSCPVFEVKPNRLPFVDGRCSLSDAKKNWCILPDIKDCHPDAEEIEFPTCDIVIESVGMPRDHSTDRHYNAFSQRPTVISTPFPKGVVSSVQTQRITTCMLLFLLICILALLLAIRLQWLKWNFNAREKSSASAS